MANQDVFPSLLGCTRLAEGDAFSLFDVKFYPFSLPNNDPIFAVTGGRIVTVCRARLDAAAREPPFDVLKIWKDDDTEASYNSVTWAEHTSGRPLLCIAGSHPKHIKILDFLRDEPDETVVRALAGHGKGINDLAVHPVTTSVIASASDDYTIRLWNTRPEHEGQPCIAIFAGEGHKQGILAMSFHPNGRWLLSGGLDTTVCLWAVPDLEAMNVAELEQQLRREPSQIVYPYFASTEVHPNYVDCLQFYGDLVISRASKNQTDRSSGNEIILWRIEGFDPDEVPPAWHPMPKPDVCTRSSFTHPPESRGFQRLLSFDIPYTDRFYLRFGLLTGPGMGPTLCMGTQKSSFLFWDLKQLQEGKSPALEPKRASVSRRRGKGRGKHIISAEKLSRLDTLRREGGNTPEQSTTMQSSTTFSTSLERKYNLSDPFTPLAAHFTITANTKLSTNASGQVKHFATTQLAWSRDGMWLVGCGDMGLICVFYRRNIDAAS